MNIKPYWLAFPVLMGLFFFGTMQLIDASGEVSKGLVLSIPSFVLYAFSFFLFRKNIISNIDYTKAMKLRNLMIFILISLVTSIAVTTLFLKLDSEVCVLTFIALNTLFAFLFLTQLFKCIHVLRGVNLSNEESKGYKYNPSNGLPTYSGYIDVKGNPVGKNN